MAAPSEQMTTTGIDVMLRDYFELLYSQDMTLFDQVFHPDAVLYSAQDGQVVVRPRAEYRTIMEGRCSPQEVNAPRHDEILMIDVLSPEMALVKVRLRLYDNVMVDYLNLLRVEDRWTIAAKLYHRAESVSA